MAENWKEIQGFPGYDISDCGNVRSWYNTRRRVNTSHPLTQSLSDKGRPIIRVRSGNRKRTLYIHRLVLEAFVGPCPDGMQACHWDDNPLNNVLSNLRWDTQKANIQDSIRNGKMHNGERSGNNKLTSKQVIEIRERYANGEMSGSLSREFGVTYIQIRSITSGRNWKHLEGPISPRNDRVGNRKIKPEQFPEILERRNAGETLLSIAKDFGVSNVTIRNYLARYNS